jgi:hypothetical protein
LRLLADNDRVKLVQYFFQRVLCVHKVTVPVPFER